MPRKFVVTAEQDEDGAWCGHIVLGERSTAISDGDTLDELRARMREAVALGLECDESEVEIELDLKQPSYEPDFQTSDVAFEQSPRSKKSPNS